MIKVDGHNNLFRDEDSGAIINFDCLEYNHYITKRNLKNKEKEEIKMLKLEVFEIKSMLNKILNEKKMS